jgi:abortive infection bacteriophage resistance protein
VIDGSANNDYYVFNNTRHASSQCAPRRVFYWYHFMIAKTYDKSPLTIYQQIALLESRGLIFNDKEQAYLHLQFISYHRLCSYAAEYEEKETRCYRPHTTFEQIIGCYVFDRKLRLLVIDAIERIEVAVRTVMTNQLALRYGSHWYMNPDLFLPRFEHDSFIQAIRKEILHQGKNKQKKREQFIQRYYDNYTLPELPPIWMVAEILSLGTWSVLFANLIHREDQKIICKPFGLNYVVMTSWLHSLTYLRNLCAHHSKLWNRHFIFTPMIAKEYAAQLTPNTSFSAQAAILRILMRTISPESHWSQRLWELVNSHPEISFYKMGFRDGWHDDPFWGIHA